MPAMVRAQTLMETRLLLRNGEQLVLALVMPLLVLVMGVLVGDDVLGLGPRPVDVLTPGVIGLAVLSTSFTSLAIATGFERRYGVLKRLGSSPLPRTGLLAAKVLSLFVVEAIQFVLIGAVAVGLGWSPRVSVVSVLSSLTLVVTGTAAFASLGLLLAGALRAEATLALANLFYVVLLVAGAVIAPASAYGATGDALVLLPSGALSAGLRAALVSGEFAAAPVAVLLGWAAVGSALTARTFRWE
ncbi:MAG: ABC transporter permease [Actinomycetota bacterium]|nr:ABC transporter permease [Actinomycetota bacterium]